MKPPKRLSGRVPSRGKAQVSHTTTIKNKSNGEELKNITETDQLNVPVVPGEEEVCVGYDIKYWASEHTGGMTVGTSAHVKLSCGPGDLDHANDVAAELAHAYMSKNAKAAQRDLNHYLGED